MHIHRPTPTAPAANIDVSLSDVPAFSSSQITCSAPRVCLWGSPHNRAGILILLMSIPAKAPTQVVSLHELFQRIPDPECMITKARNLTDTALGCTVFLFNGKLSALTMEQSTCYTSEALILTLVHNAQAAGSQLCVETHVALTDSSSAVRCLPFVLPRYASISCHRRVLAQSEMFF